MAWGQWAAQERTLSSGLGMVGRFTPLLRCLPSVRIVATPFAACVLTGQEADLDGVCVEHGETACVMTVGAATPLYEQVVSDAQCTHRHDIHPVRRLPIDPG
jgi:hypothetical protein